VLTPHEVLAQTQAIERELGKQRQHATRRSAPTLVQPAEQVTQAAIVYKDRPIDIDILLYDNLTLNDPDLQIPHPLMTKRDFVMIPLREIQEHLPDIIKEPR